MLYRSMSFITADAYAVADSLATDLHAAKPGMPQSEMI
jgi:hypothetical protein